MSGVIVEATPEITVSLDTAGTAGAQVQVANTGNSQIRSVHVSVTPDGSKTPTESFIGTLNVDDFSSVSLPSGSARSVNVEVRFKDSRNAEHLVSQTLETNGNQSFVQGGARQGTTLPTDNLSRGRNVQGGNPLGMLFGGNRAGAGAQSGPNYVLIGIGVAVIAAIAFFAYRHFKKGGKMPLHIPFGIGKARDGERGKK